MPKVQALKAQLNQVTQQRDELLREFEAVRRNYIGSENFISSLWVHTETEDNNSYDILRTEMNALSNNIQRHQEEHSVFFKAIKTMGLRVFD